MIALAYQIRSLRWTFSLAYIAITTPTAFIVWSVTRTLSLVLPQQMASASDEMFYEMYQRMLLFLFEELTGIQIYFHYDIPKRCDKENAIVIFNHQCTSDWILASSIGVRSGSVGIVRYILKESLKRIPFYGFYLEQHGCIYLNRENFFESKMKEQMEQYTKKNYWMVIFPEGTRFNPTAESTIHKSKEYATTNGLKPLAHVLAPRSKGFEMCLKYLNNPRCIYDMTIIYDDTSKFIDGQIVRLKGPTLLDLLKGKCQSIYVHINRIPIQSIPSGSQELKDWLHQRFLLKDNLLEEFYSYENSRVTDPGQLAPLGIMATLPSFLFFLGVNTLLLSTRTGRKVYLASILCGSLITASTFVFKR